MWPDTLACLFIVVTGWTVILCLVGLIHAVRLLAGWAGSLVARRIGGRT